MELPIHSEHLKRGHYFQVLPLLKFLSRLNTPAGEVWMSGPQAVFF